MTNIIRDDFTSIREKLLSIEKEFEEKLTEVEIKAKEFRELDHKLTEKKNENDFPIKIIVGGKIFVCKFSTILGVKDTIFYNLFANYLKQGLEIPKELFFDRNYTYYTHFLTNRVFTDENFTIEFESSVSQTDNYYYIGIINESYSTSGNCGCCNPSNSYYIQCDGSTHINSTRNNGTLSWYSQSCIIGMRVYLSDKTIYFYKDTPDNEVGPFTIVSGTNFRVFAGHCNSGNGELKILSCRLI